MKSTAPDLENGFVVLASTSANAWATEVLCAVKQLSADGERRHYLSKECRSEDVPFMEGGQAGPIFQADRSWEFVMAVIDGKAIQLTNSDIAVLNEPATGESPEDTFPEPVVMAASFTTEVHCPDRDVRIVPVAEALERLRGHRLPVRNLFMRVAWAAGEAGTELYCPCRYVNFGTATDGTGDYVQPISGYVMVPHASAGIQIGYVACALAADGRTRMEFCAKSYRNVFQWAADLVESEGNDGSRLRGMAGTLPIAATVFDRVMAIDGTCELYEYA